MEQSTQILVIGGGPGGSTAATFLAREGFNVTLIERAVFPRYHIGESLLPSCLEVLDLMGAREKVDAYGFQRKEGGFFAWGRDSWELDFRKLRHPYSYQVVRAEFDQVLLEHAKSQGVKVYEGYEVRSLVFDGDRPRSALWSRVKTDRQTEVNGTNDHGNGAVESGEISFDYLIDATGRAGLMATRYLRNRHYHEAFQNVGVWAYYRGAIPKPDAPIGALVIGAIPEGWIWSAPLHDGTMSVGVVMHKTTFKQKREQASSVKQVFLDAVNSCPLILDIVKTGKLVTEVMAEQDYSYMSEHITGPGYFMVGDAACFIDPLLSTGVHLATHGALLAAASLASVLRGEVTEQEAMVFFDENYRHAFVRLMVIISALYQQYNGKETYFWHAQGLTNYDYDGEALNQAFVYIVSGLEDLKDTERAERERNVIEMTKNLPPEEAQRAQVMYQAYNRVFWRASMSADTAVNGVYVRTRPHLGLAKVEENAIEIA
jgi:flavin-dependent dehydrogenase